MSIKTKMSWSDDHRAFLGLVIEDDTIVTIGVMKTKDEMQAWLDDAVARKAWEDGSELPDLYDQAQIH